MKWEEDDLGDDLLQLELRNHRLEILGNGILYCN
jgi:hypothetical protein